MTAEKGETVTFVCGAEGIPSPTVMWFEEDLNMNAFVTSSGARVIRCADIFKFSDHVFVI